LGMFEKVVVIDARGHLLGRLSSVLAKELLGGQKVVIVRCEELQISGSLFRNQLIFSKFLQHRGNTNPKRGPVHYRSPARILWRTVRGMIPHKTQRGAAALERMKIFEGVPHPYDRMKRVVVPAALRILRLKPGRKFCRLGDLASSVGWAHNGLIAKLETKRKTKSSAYYVQKKQMAGLKAKAIASLGDKLNTLATSAPVAAASKPTKAPVKETKAAPKGEKKEKEASPKKEKEAPKEAKKEKEAAPEKKEAPKKDAAPAPEKKKEKEAPKEAAPEKKKEAPKEAKKEKEVAPEKKKEAPKEAKKEAAPEKKKEAPKKKSDE